MTLSPLDELFAAAFRAASPQITGEMVERLIEAVRKHRPSYSSRLRTPAQLAKESPFAVTTLLRLAGEADTNGLADLEAVVRLDTGRYLFHIDRFDAWLSSRNVRPCVRPRLSSVMK